MKRENTGGSWKKAKENLKKLKELAKELQELEKKRVETFLALKRVSIESYYLIPVVDCLLGDSPLSPQKLLYQFTEYSKKLGMEGIKGIFTPDVNIREFVSNVEDAVKWGLKFENEKAS